MKKTIRPFFYLTLLLLLFVVSGCTKAARESRAIARADSDFKAGRYTRAETEYIRALQLGGGDPASVAVVYTKLGRVYFAQGRWLDAARYLSAGLERKTNDVPSKVMVGESFFFMGLGFWPRAFEEFKAALQMRPGHPEAMVLLGDSAGFSAASISNAFSILDSQPEPAKKTAAYMTAKGTVFLRSNNLDAAEKEYKAALKLDHEFYRAHLGMALVHGLRNDIETAKIEARAAIATLPNRSGAISACLITEYSLGEKKEATDVAISMTQKIPDFVPPYLFLATIAFQEGNAMEEGKTLRKERYDESLSFLKKALAKDPENFSGLTLCGDVYLAKMDGTNALAYYQRARDVLNQPTPSLLVKMGNAFWANSDLTSAKAVFRQALDANTNVVYAEAALALADITVKQRDARAARDLTPKLIKLTNQQLTNQPPLLLGAYIQLADLYLTQSDADNAIKTMEVAQKQFTNVAQFPYLLGEIYQRLGKKTEARKAFEQALKLAPQNLIFLQALIMQDLANGGYDDAYKLISSYITTNGVGLAPLHYIQGVVFQEGSKMPGDPEQKAKRIDGAITSFKKAIDLDSTYAPAYFSLAEVYAKTHQEQQALKELHDYLGKTNNASAHLLAAQIHEQLKEYREAETEYERILAMNETKGITLLALNNLACLYTDHTTNKWEEAYELAQRARKIAPRSSSIADTLGWAAFRKGDYSRALTLLQEATADREYAAKPVFLYHLAMVHYVTGKEETARETFKQALDGAEEKRKAANTGSSTEAASESTPDWVQDAKIKLTNLSLNTAAADPGLETELQNRLSAAPGDPVLLRRLGTVQERQGEYKLALKSYEEALKLNPTHTGIRLQVALLYAGPMNNLIRGLDLAKKVRSDAPNDSEAIRVEGQLAYRSGDYRLAVARLEESTHNYPDDASLSYDLGAAYYCDGRGVDAEQEMSKLADSGAAVRRADAKQFLSFTAAAKEPGKNPEVVQSAKAIMEKATNNMPAMMLVAADYEARKEDYTNAVKLYSSILRDFPRFIPAARNLGLLYFSNAQDRDKAYELLNRVREKYSEDAVFCRALGILACQRGDYARAVQLLQSIAGGQAEDPEALFYLGKAQFYLKRPAEARGTLERALQRGLRKELDPEARKMIISTK